jgi:hypothetical protein
LGKGLQMSVGRNDPCPCNSGLKYKRCCLNKDELRRQEILQKSRELTGDNLAEYLLSLGVVRGWNETDAESKDWQEWFKNDLAEGQRNLQEAKEMREKQLA